MLKVVFLAMLICSTTGYSQISLLGDCGSALNICDGDSIACNPTSYGLVDELTSGTTSNPSSNPQPGHAGCLLAGESSSNWCILNVSTSGNLAFSLRDTAGVFIDWNLWLYDSTACFQILNTTHPIVSCNWNSTASGLSGMANPTNYPPGATPQNFQDEIPVLAGEQYLLCFNTSNVNNYVHFNSLGTAQLCGTSNNDPCIGTYPIVSSISTSPTFCVNSCNGAINLNALSNSDSVLYTLNNVSNYSGIFTGLCSGTYDIAIQDSAGCVQYGSLFVEQSVPPSTLSSPYVVSNSINACDIFCDTLLGFGLVDYEWFTDSTLSYQQSIYFCDSVPNELHLTGIDTVGCQADTISIIFNNLDYGLSTVGIFSTVDTVQFGGVADICVDGWDPNLTYLWDTGDSGPCITIYPVDSASHCLTISDSCGRTIELCHTVYAESNLSIQEVPFGGLSLTHKPFGFTIKSNNGTLQKTFNLTLFNSLGQPVYRNINYTLGEIFATEKLSHGVYYIVLEGIDSTFKYSK